jgi:transposase-like protein
MKGKNLKCNECGNDSFKITIGYAESERNENHRTQLIRFKCNGCGHEYAMQNEILNAERSVRDEEVG